MEKIDNRKFIVRKIKEEDFEQIYELIVNVHNLHVKERKDIYINADPLDIDTFKEELANVNNLYLVAERKSKIVGICFA